MKEENKIDVRHLEDMTEKIIDVFCDHQYELSDGFNYYEDSNTWPSIRKDIRKILQEEL